MRASRIPETVVIHMSANEAEDLYFALADSAVREVPAVKVLLTALTEKHHGKESAVNQ